MAEVEIAALVDLLASCFLCASILEGEFVSVSG